MSKKDEPVRPEARLPKGLFDTSASELRATADMLAKIRVVFESYGFEPLDTPAIEYADALGKFLPDQDRPNEGVFSFKDDDDQWLSLRYDLTAPLARYVAVNYHSLPKPFRRYQSGAVWRNEKPGPGRFRQFTQFDADTVGAASIAADAELCMLAADTLEKLGVPRGSYVIKVNSRKVLDGLLEAIALEGEDSTSKRLSVLRAIDKLDRLGEEGVRALLGKGRKDDSGDFTKGAGLELEAIERVMTFVGRNVIGVGRDEVAGKRPLNDMERVGPFEFMDNYRTLEHWTNRIGGSPLGDEGIAELRQLVACCEAAGYGSKRIRIDSSVVRGLEYYTGTVFEADLTFEVIDDKGRFVRFGSVGAGGRYDGLIGRFLGDVVPATGFSVGVSRLLSALIALRRVDLSTVRGPVVVLVLDRDRIADYQRHAQDLRKAGIRAELYLGEAGMKAQMKYADKRGSPCVVIQGGDERVKGEVTIKDLIEGAEASKAIANNVAWREERPGQFTVPETDLVNAVRGVLARHKA